MTNHTDEAKALVERLRDSFIYDQQHYAPDPLVAEAAALIETQAREIAAKDAEIERLLIAAAATVKGSIDQYKRGYNDAIAALAGDSNE